MARAVVPATVPPVGPLPFTQRAELLESDGTVVVDPSAAAAMPLSPVWPASTGATTATGRSFDHRAEAPVYFAAALQVPNRRIRDDDGVLYTIVDATPHLFLPHVDVRLREVRPG